MPVEVESSGQVSEVLRVLRERLGWVLVPFLLITSLGVAFAVIVPKKYVASTRLMVHDIPGATGSSGGTEQGKIATHLIRSPRRVEAVIIQDLGWPYQQLSNEEQENFMEKVLGNLAVDTPNMGTGVSQQAVHISYADTDPTRAYEFVNAVSARWRDEVLEGSRNAKKAEFSNLEKRMRQMESRMMTISDQIAEIHRANDIPPLQLDGRRDAQLDPAYQRLDSVRLQMAEIGLRIDKVAALIVEEEASYEKMDDQISFEETVTGVDVSESILEEEEKILALRQEIVTKGYTPQHSRYMSIQSEIREREEVIRLLNETARQGVTSEERLVVNQAKLSAGEILETRRGALIRDKALYEALEVEEANLASRTKELQTVYQELETLNAERHRKQELLTEIEADYNEMRREMDILESSAGNPFTILDEAKMPVNPTQPNPWLIVAFSVMASLGLGLGLALALEYTRGGFRSVNDITRVMVVPVLGTVNRIRTSKERRGRAVRRLLVGGSTITFVAAVSLLTWAWALRPDLLTDDWRESIDVFRSNFE